MEVSREDEFPADLLVSYGIYWPPTISYIFQRPQTYWSPTISYNSIWWRCKFLGHFRVLRVSRGERVFCPPIVFDLPGDNKRKALKTLFYHESAISGSW